MKLPARRVALAAALAMATGCSTLQMGGSLPTGAAAFNAGSLAPLARERVKIREFADLPGYGGTYYHPDAIASGPGGLLWVLDSTEQDYSSDVVVGVATTGKTRHRYRAHSSYAGYEDIAAGPDGALWLTDGGGKIARLTTAGHFTHYRLKDASPISITSGPDGALWFTATTNSASAIGRITTNGKVTTYALGPEPWDIAAGSDGALWFTEPFTEGIGRITTSGTLTEYNAGITAQPFYIRLGADGAMWFTEGGSGGPKIGRITTSGDVTEYSQGITPTNVLYGMASGPDDAMWFTEYGSYYGTPKIGRIAMNGTVKEYSQGLPAQAGPRGIVTGPDAMIWFTDALNIETGRVKP